MAVSMQARPEAELLAAFDTPQLHSAFAELVQRWDGPIYGFLVKASGDAEAAKDLRQEVFLRVYRGARTYRAEYAFSTWLFRIAVNVLSSWRARSGKRSLRETAFADPPDSALADTADPSQSAEQRELRAALWHALDQLPPQDRELLLLRFQAGMNYREIGTILEIPETTAKSRVYALLRNLQPALAPYRD